MLNSIHKKIAIKLYCDDRKYIFIHRPSSSNDSALYAFYKHLYQKER